MSIAVFKYPVIRFVFGFHNAQHAQCTFASSPLPRLLLNRTYVTGYPSVLIDFLQGLKSLWTFISAVWKSARDRLGFFVASSSCEHTEEVVHLQRRDPALICIWIPNIVGQKKQISSCCSTRFPSLIPKTESFDFWSRRTFESVGPWRRLR
jgi:hypothetical protein